ncbi:STAS domain-containing protein [Streptomyces sp. LN785]|uniref:STAS domain-containing protein n=1 Tax=Streptomyces sp. LN785 TaxID=3112983 RepID=UPI0037249836
MSPLTITARDAATGPVLEITGELDRTTAPELRQAADSLTPVTGQLLVLDLAGLEFSDSSGIAALLAARTPATEQSAETALTAVPANTARILRLVGLDRVFTHHSGRPTATDLGSAGADHQGRATGH